MRGHPETFAADMHIEPVGCYYPRPALFRHSHNAPATAAKSTVRRRYR
jgi:hypothetical protein